MRRIDKYDLYIPEDLTTVLRGYFDIEPDDLIYGLNSLFSEIDTKKRYQLIKCDEDLERIAHEHENYCNNFDGQCRDGCKYGDKRFHSCFVNYLLEEVEVNK